MDKGHIQLMAESMAQAVEHLPNKCSTLTLNPIVTKKMKDIQLDLTINSNNIHIFKTLSF
jgi:hypothetical protein